MASFAGPTALGTDAVGCIIGHIIVTHDDSGAPLQFPNTSMANCSGQRLLRHIHWFPIAAAFGTPIVCHATHMACRDGGWVCSGTDYCVLFDRCLEELALRVLDAIDHR
jgi:hypothetical protein